MTNINNMWDDFADYILKEVGDDKITKKKHYINQNGHTSKGLKRC